MQAGSPPQAGVGIGTVLADTYEITALIGKGGMGAVWAARHRRLPKVVAVKVLLDTVRAGTEEYARFRREAEIASRLGHPNIVEVLDFNELPDGTPYIVMEYLEGESLAVRIAKGPMGLAHTLEIVRQIGAALGAAHRRLVVHRDLKPENVFLCRRDDEGAATDHVKILDFGISKIWGSQSVHTRTDTMIGTPQYMAPEQVAGQHDLVDGRTDQFALAAIVCEMLSGRALFGGTSVIEVVHRIVYEPLPPLASRLHAVPAPVVRALERALSKRRDERFPDIAAFVAALRAGAGEGAPAGQASVADLALAGTAVTPSGGAPSGAAPAAAAPAALATTALPPSGAAPPALAATALPPSGAAPPALAATALPPSGAASPASPLTPGPASPGSPVSDESCRPIIDGERSLASKPASGSRPTRGLVVAVIGVVAVLATGVAAWLALRGRSAPPPAPLSSPGSAAATQRGVPATDGAAASTQPPRDLHTPDRSRLDASLASPRGGDAGTSPGRASTGPASEGKPADGQKAPGSARPRVQAPSAVEGPLPPEAAAALDEAERALGRRDFEKASLFARRALRIARSGRAYAILVLAACGEKDIGGARAFLPHVPRTQRSRVMRECAQAGIDLR